VIDAQAFARVICDWCLEVQPGQQVLVASTTLAEEPVLAIHDAILDRGAWPLVRLSPPTLTERFFTHAGAAQIDAFPPVEMSEMNAIDAFVNISAPANTRALAGVDPELVTRAGRARQQLQEIRLSKRWCGSQWPTPALAQQAGMGETAYTEFVRGALFLDRPDPLAAWQTLSARQARLVERLSQVREIRIESDGTELTLRVDGRTWINSDGRRNMPSGEVFTGPLEDSANGTIRFDVPSLPRGVEVRDVVLTFEHGKVIEASAAVGDDFLQATLEADTGARFLGELGIGSNTGITRATGSTLLDEKIAGTVHLALGRSYPETGGTNVSSVHWDLICDLRSGGRLSADSESIVEDGELVL
jgi:aminopeptidase